MVPVGMQWPGDHGVGCGTFCGPIIQAQRNCYRISGHRARESAKEREKRLLRRRAVALQREFLAASSTTESRSS